MKKAVMALIILMLAIPLMAQEYSLKKAVFGSCGGALESEQAIVRFAISQTLFQKQLHEEVNVFWGFWSVKQVATGIEDEDLTPKFIFELRQNFPNPFNPVTTIPYSVGGSSAVFVNLRIYDVRGALVRTLVSEAKSPGTYNALWDGKNGFGKSVSSGIYFYQIQGDSFVKTRKLVLLR
jgi:hypothetical protein